MIRCKIKRKCKHCKEFFTPNPKNAYHQVYCSNPVCIKASKAASQKRWLNKPENKNYFSGPDHVRRVQVWRKAHPGYWRKKTSSNQNALQDLLNENTEQKQSVHTNLTKHALQDVLTHQHTVLIGLISHLTGSALQDDIALTVGRMQQLGSDILYQPNNCKGGQHAKTSHLSAAYPQSSKTVQLGGSSAGR
jgi:hypothetical protein